MAKKRKADEDINLTKTKTKSKYEIKEHYETCNFFELLKKNTIFCRFTSTSAHHNHNQKSGFIILQNGYYKDSCTHMIKWMDTCLGFNGHIRYNMNNFEKKWKYYHIEIIFPVISLISKQPLTVILDNKNIQLFDDDYEINNINFCFFNNCEDFLRKKFTSTDDQKLLNNINENERNNILVIKPYNNHSLEFVNFTITGMTHKESLHHLKHIFFHLHTLINANLEIDIK